MNTTPSQRLGFLHHIRLVPLFACILGGILVLFALSSALAGYFLWQADRDQRDVRGFAPISSKSLTLLR